MKSREQLIKGEEKAIGKFALGIAASIKLIAASTGKKRRKPMYVSSNFLDRVASPDYNRLFSRKQKTTKFVCLNEKHETQITSTIDMSL